MTKAYLLNPHFAAYTRWLFQLHGLVATEQGESDEADALREQMDAEWVHLTPRECDELKRLSHDLDKFHDERGLAETSLAS